MLADFMPAGRGLIGEMLYAAT
eukprot:COSAG06_NODE_59913_length_272_cov_1.497110_1_plen_21_part_10